MNYKKAIALVIDFIALIGTPVALIGYSYATAEDVQVSGVGLIKPIFLLLGLIAFLIYRRFIIKPYFDSTQRILDNHYADWEKSKDEEERQDLIKLINKRKQKMLVYNRSQMIITLLLVYIGISIISSIASDAKAIIGWYILSVGVGTTAELTLNKVK